MKKLFLFLILFCSVFVGYCRSEQNSQNMSSSEIEQSDLPNYLQNYYEMRPASDIVHSVEIPTVIVKVNSTRRSFNVLFALKEAITKQEYKSLLFTVAVVDRTYNTLLFEKGYFIFELCKIRI